MMLHPDVPVVLFDSGPNGTPSLTYVDLTTFSENAVGTSCFQAKIILDRLK
jgi:hypothetical protein